VRGEMLDGWLAGCPLFEPLRRPVPLQCGVSEDVISSSAQPVMIGKIDLMGCGRITNQQPCLSCGNVLPALANKSTCGYPNACTRSIRNKSIFVFRSSKI